MKTFIVVTTILVLVMGITLYVTALITNCQERHMTPNAPSNETGRVF